MACSSKRSQPSDLCRYCKEIENEFRELKRMLKKKNNSPEKLRSILERIQRNLERFEEEIKNSDFAPLIGFVVLKRSELQELIQSKDRQEEKIEEINEERENLKEKLKESMNEKESQSTEIARLSKELHRDKKECENLQKRIDKNMEEIERQETEIAQMNRELDKEKKECKNLEEKLKKSTDEKESQATEIAMLNKDLEKDRKECENLQKRLDRNTEEIERKKETIKGLESIIEERTAEKEKSILEIETSKSFIKKLEKEKKALQEDVKNLRHEIQRQTEIIQEYTRAYENQHRSLEEQRRSIDKLQKSLSEEKKAKENALNRLSAAAANRLRDQNPGITDLSDPNRPLKLAEKVSELYDNEWTNAMENLESELNIQEEKGIKILLKIIKNVFDACTEFGDNHLQSFPDMLILPPSFIKRGEEKMISIRDLPSEMLKPMKDFRKSHAKHAINHLQKFFSTDEGKPKLHIKEKVFKACEEYVNKCIELCWMMRIQDPPIYMETEYPTNSEFDSNKMRSYTKAGKFIHFVVWPTFFLHKDGPLLAKGVVQGSKIEIKDIKEINGDEECSSSSSDSDGEEFDDARSRTDSQPRDNLKKTASQDDAEPNQQGNKEISQEADGTSVNETNDKPEGPNDTNDIAKGPNNTDTKPEEPNNTDEKPKEPNNDLHINQSKPQGSEAADQEEPVNSDETEGEDGSERAAEQRDASVDKTQNKAEETDV